MRFFAASLLGLAALCAAVPTAQTSKHRNPIITLLEQHKPVFGVYAPSNGGRRGQPAPERPASALATDALAYANADFLFNGSAENGIDRAMPAITAFVSAMDAAGGAAKTRFFGVARPLVLKIPKIDPDRAKAVENIGRELNAGAAGIMFVETESAAEVRAGIAAMRFKAKGGTRADDDVGAAPAHWGVSAAEYRKHADLWPLNPDGELINWTIVESLEGLKHVREIAQVKGVGVLWPGAGTLRNDVFTRTNANGERVFDAVGWENAIQQVLAACKEFHVPCGYPANTPEQMDERMKQGFTVFISSWGESGFKAIEEGRKVGGR